MIRLVDMHNYTDAQFSTPKNPQKSAKKVERNIADFANLETDILVECSSLKSMNLDLMRMAGEVDPYYDDDIVNAISVEFGDRLIVLPIIGNLIVTLGFLRKRKDIVTSQFIESALRKLTSRERISRYDIAKLTKIAPSSYNSFMPFMNGGPADENWDKAKNGFFDWIDNNSQESILGIELGFKADDYGLEVSRKLIEKKVKNPNIYISILIDGLVSLLMQKSTKSLNPFENGTLKMIFDMKNAGINVHINDSWNPLSEDFLAANHIKLWIFDGKMAFFGGIGIESHFRDKMYDEMDLVEGPFVNILTMMALLLMANQRSLIDSLNKVGDIQDMSKDEIKSLFLKNLPEKGSINVEISMNVPGYVKDARDEYIDLLTDDNVEEIYIMAPYFSDDKIARALVKASNRLCGRFEKEKRYRIELLDKNKPKQEIRQIVREELEHNKRVHIIFPKKQENRIIEEVSKYYAYYLRTNPIVESRQFYAKIPSGIYEMLHAKQMVVVLKDHNRNWTKYVKFGGSYNPAGRAHNMWELNAIMYKGDWGESDEGPNASSENPIRDYLNNVMKVVVEKYSEPFPWGDIDVKLSMLDMIVMKFAQLLPF